MPLIVVVKYKLVLVQWQTGTNTQVQVEAGLLQEEYAADWTTIDLLDTFSLWHCARCGRLVGAKSHTLPEELQQEHFHGHSQPVLRDITVAESFGGYQLFADLLLERRGTWLLSAYADSGLHIHSAAEYLPEPAVAGPLSLEDKQRVQLLTILRELKRFGAENTNQPYWASASRLLSDWRHHHSVSQVGQGVFALSTLLRAAAKRPKQFYRLLKEASLTEKDIQELLARLNRTAPKHVRWGLIWAELLMVHST